MVVAGGAGEGSYTAGGVAVDLAPVGVTGTGLGDLGAEENGGNGLEEGAFHRFGWTLRGDLLRGRFDGSFGSL
jgi:hypothetical protein